MAETLGVGTSGAHPSKTGAPVHNPVPKTEPQPTSGAHFATGDSVSHSVTSPEASGYFSSIYSWGKEKLGFGGKTATTSQLSKPLAHLTPKQKAVVEAQIENAAARDELAIARNNADKAKKKTPEYEAYDRLHKQFNVIDAKSNNLEKAARKAINALPSQQALKDAETLAENASNELEVATLSEAKTKETPKHEAALADFNAKKAASEAAAAKLVLAQQEAAKAMNELPEQIAFMQSKKELEEATKEFKKAEKTLNQAVKYSPELVALKNAEAKEKSAVAKLTSAEKNEQSQQAADSPSVDPDERSEDADLHTTTQPASGTTQPASGTSPTVTRVESENADPAKRNTGLQKTADKSSGYKGWHIAVSILTPTVLLSGMIIYMMMHQKKMNRTMIGLQQSNQQLNQALQSSGPSTSGYGGYQQ